MVYASCYCKFFIFAVFVLLFAGGCKKNLSHYYADPETPGVGIFSNKGNNVLSCIINGQPWRTIDRMSGGFLSPGSYEVLIERQTTNGLLDTLTISWEGNYNGGQYDNGYLKLILPIAKNFRFSDLSALQGKRLQIDSTNGYFSFRESLFNSINNTGTGSIYFNTASFDSTRGEGYRGNMSGLLEANFGSTKLSSGRFDHLITSGQVRFF